MFIKEVCQECNLTRKAVEYYERQGLIHPGIAENGYRIYEPADLKRLKEIALLRKLNISVADIYEIINSEDKTSVLSRYKYHMEISLQKMGFQLNQIDQLIKNNYDLQNIEQNLKDEQKNVTIKEKILQAFPGSFGTLLTIHFGMFLNEHTDTAEKEKAYLNILDFLDSVIFPVDLEEKLQDLYKGIDITDFESFSQEMHENIIQFESKFPDMEESISKYLEYQNSEEYQKSSVYVLKQALIGFFQNSGYYEIFIPNLQVLSAAYREYSEKLEDANKLFLEKYSESN